MTRSWRSFSAALALVAWGGGLHPARAIAVEVVIRNTNDSGKGSLRYEVAQASAGDLIQFASGLQGKTIKLTSGPITISKSLIIWNFNNSQVTVSGGGTNRVFVVNTPTGTYSYLIGLTVTGGVAPTGGAILNKGGGTLSLFSDVFTGNKAMGTAPGRPGSRCFRRTNCRKPKRRDRTRSAAAGTPRAS